MSQYRYGYSREVIVRHDGAFIPDDPANPDWIEYRDWLDAGGMPDPYVAPPLPSARTPIIPRNDDG